MVAHPEERGGGGSVVQVDVADPARVDQVDRKVESLHAEQRAHLAFAPQTLPSVDPALDADSHEHSPGSRRPASDGPARMGTYTPLPGADTPGSGAAGLSGAGDRGRPPSSGGPPRT